METMFDRQTIYIQLDHVPWHCEITKGYCICIHVVYILLRGKIWKAPVHRCLRTVIFARSKWKLTPYHQQSQRQIAQDFSGCALHCSVAWGLFIGRRQLCPTEIAILRFLK